MFSTPWVAILYGIAISWLVGGPVVGMLLAAAVWFIFYCLEK